MVVEIVLSLPSCTLLSVATGDEVAYSDGSKLILEGVGASGHRRCWKGDVVGTVAMVWDGQVAGMIEGLRMSRRVLRVLLLADSRAAIAAVKKAGRTGKARSRHLKTVFEMRQGTPGGGVKKHQHTAVNTT